MKKPSKNIYKFPKKRYKEIKGIIDKRYNILILIIISIVIILFTNLFYLQIIKREHYLQRVLSLSDRIIKGDTAPRGRIYDRNGVLIVDNKPNKIISYKKQLGVSSSVEINLAYKVANMIDVNYSNLTERQLKNFWIKQNIGDANLKIKDEEWTLLKERKLSNTDINKLIFERITDEDLKDYNELDKEAAYIYHLMNIGYSYSEKVIKKSNITEDEYAKIAENQHLLNGFTTRLDWNREYIYDSVLKSVLGNVSTTEQGIPFEMKDYYLEKGYSLNDRVGTTGIEFQYENYLRGIKDEFQLLKDGSFKIVNEGQRGNDIVLTIDIELQKEVERIIEENLIKAKGEFNTEYFDKTFVIISNPQTGEILAMSGKQVVKKDDEYIIYDYTPGIYTYSVVAGSSVKGASHIVGYNNNALKIGEIRDDACIKIASTPLKCSYRYSGIINDVTALKVSSNVYQFHTAIKLGKATYSYNQPLSIDKKAFEIYRNTFKEFGLGIKTGIDLPNESLGYSGSSTLSGHLLDFAIGQYDTYTPIQLSQYINTIANDGIRLQPFLLKEVKNDLFTSSPIVLGKVNTKEEYIKRVQEGFIEVMKPGGTGFGLIDLKHLPSGKTGTSESFIDTNNDGKIDTQTISNTYVAYAPSDNPKVSFTVVSPDVTHPGSKINYTSPVNRIIAREIAKKFFEIYE
jgi:penicillin-binding protein A